MNRCLALGVLALFAVGCSRQQARSGHAPPQWSMGAVWYQIFPERFCNGDPSNDPLPVEAAAPGLQGQTSPWTANWYALQPWETSHAADFYQAAFARRYGGDLQGMIDKLDYLRELHVDALYLNPIFDARSSHKYDASSFHHIDRHLGPDPRGDAERVAGETDDPRTWIWTSADTLFLQFLSAAHQRGLKVIIDGVFNHVGTDFWAFRDLVHRGPASPFQNWFVVRAWDDPQTPENEFQYQGYWDLPGMPVLREDRNGVVAGPREYLLAITRRWMDPNGDGDPRDGVDGWRLDALSEMEKDGFWEEWCRLVRRLNPEAYMVGEIWGLAEDWLAGDRFDAVMNYPVAYAMRNFFIGGEERWSPTQFDAALRDIRAQYRPVTNHVMQVLIDSHDTDRVASMAKNDGSRGYDQNASPRTNPEYDPTRPGDGDWQTQVMIAAFQATYVGAPMIYYGAEAGMWGGDDPDCRKPMVWPDLQYEPETYTTISHYTERDSVYFHAALSADYQKLMQLRRRHPALREGSFTSLRSDDQTGIYAFLRQHQDDAVLAVFNVGAAERMVTLSLPRLAGRTFQELWSGQREQPAAGELNLVMAPRTAQIWERLEN